jgi:hypothetical protein
MSTINSKNVQVGTSGVANQNFTLYQPNTPDGTVRLGVGNSGVTTSDVVTVTNAGNMTVTGAVAGGNLSYTGTLTGSTGVVNIGSGQFYKDASGNVGVGTTSPRDVTDYVTLALNDTTGGLLDFLAAGTRVATVSGNTSNLTVGSVTAIPIVFNTNTNERLRIDSSGNFLFNKTTTAASGSGVAFETNDTSSFYRGGDGSALRFFRSSTQVGRIDVTGTNTSYVTSSDYRLKEDIQPMTGALARVAALKPCTYKWKSTGEESQGFIAHELAEVCPDAVSGEKDAVDEEGKIKPQGIDTSFLVATLTAAIQELTARVQALEAK